MADASKRAAQVRRKQMLVLGGVGLAIALVSVGASVWLQPAAKHDPRVEQPKTRQLSLGGTATDREAWRVQSSAEMEKMTKRLAELESREAAREAKIKVDAAERLNRPADPSAGAQGVIVPPPTPPARQNAGPPPEGLFSQVGPTDQVVPPPLRPGAAPMAPDQIPPQGPRIRSVSIEDPSTAADAPASKAPGGEIVNSARKFGEEEARRRAQRGGSDAGGSAGKDRYSDDDPLAYNRAGGRTAETYLPAGTFVRAMLLNGLDAPTGGQAQQNPHPVLLRLEANAQLPNDVRAKLQGCVITGNGHGDLSSERAYIRLDRLSCVDEAGGAIEVAVRGYVSGEDGKAGLRGRLITKTGQVLANAIFVGALGGFGEALRQGAVTTTTATATGAQTQNVNNTMEYGLGTGIGKAMDRVAQYYIKLADKLFPVVEIDGSRVIDVVLTRGVSIERR